MRYDLYRLGRKPHQRTTQPFPQPYNIAPRKSAQLPTTHVLICTSFCTLTCSVASLVVRRRRAPIRLQAGTSSSHPRGLKRSSRSVRITCAERTRQRNRAIVHECTICNKSFSTTLQQGFHFWSKTHLILLAQSKVLLCQGRFRVCG